MSASPESQSTNPLNRYHSIGIILAGGGAKGAYQAGALAAIHDFLSRYQAHEKVRMIAGTSIGSWNALFWLAGLVDKTNEHGGGLEQWWSNLSLFDLVRPTLYIPALRNYLLSATPWEKCFERLFESEEAVATRLKRHIEDPNGQGSMHFYLTRSNVVRARLEVTTNRRDLNAVPANLPAEGWVPGIHRVDTHVAQTLDDLRTAVFTSMDLPPVFPYARIGDQFFEDGGVIDNLPIQFGTECERCDLLFILPLNATFSRDVNHRSLIRRLLRVMDVRQGVLERNSFKMVYLYNELAALRHRIENIENLAKRAVEILGRDHDTTASKLAQELQHAMPNIPVQSTKDTPLADCAQVRRHDRVQVFAICPAPKLAVNTIDFWKRNKAAQAFRLMRDATSIELQKFFAQPPEYIRMALVQPSRDVLYLEQF